MTVMMIGNSIHAISNLIRLCLKHIGPKLAVVEALLIWTFIAI